MVSRGVRGATPDDVDSMLAIYAPIVARTAISFELVTPGIDEFTQRVLAAGERGDPWFVLEIDGVVAGYAYASLFRARPAYSATRETTVYVSPDHHGRGVGTELLAAVLADLAPRGVHEVVAGIVLPNEASIALHERLGFQPVGVFPRVGFKFEQWHDLGFWQRSL